MTEETTQVETEEPSTLVQTEAQGEVETASGVSEELLAGKYKSAEDLVNAYKSLESKIGEKEDAIRERLQEEFSQPKEGVPLSAGEYELPDFVESEDAVNSDSLRSWAEYCHDQGYNQDEFQKGLELYMEALPEKPDLEAESKQLGDNASARIEAASLFANKFFPAEAMSAIERMCEGADGILAMEAIMQKLQDPSVSSDTQSAAAVDEESLTAMMKDERYWNPRVRDDHFVKKVESGFKKLYG